MIILNGLGSRQPFARLPKAMVISAALATGIIPSTSSGETQHTRQKSRGIHQIDQSRVRPTKCDDPPEYCTHTWLITLPPSNPDKKGTTVEINCTGENCDRVIIQFPGNSQ